MTNKTIIQSEYNIINGKWENYIYTWNGENYDKKPYNNTTKREKYVLITVNPKPEISVGDMLQLYKRARKKNWIINTHSTIEWRKEKEGMHLHMLAWVIFKKAKSQIHKEIYNTFKHVVGNKNHVNIQINKVDPGKMITYIEGYKNGLPKANQLHDMQNRIQLGIVTPLEWLKDDDYKYLSKSSQK